MGVGRRNNPVMTLRGVFTSEQASNHRYQKPGERPSVRIMVIRVGQGGLGYRRTKRNCIDGPTSGKGSRARWDLEIHRFLYSAPFSQHQIDLPLPPLHPRHTLLSDLYTRYASRRVTHHSNDNILVATTTKKSLYALEKTNLNTSFHRGSGLQCHL